MSQSGSFGGSDSAGTVETLTGNAGGAVGPDLLGDISIAGAGAITVTGTPGTNSFEITTSAAIGDFVTDAGTANPALGALNILGGTNLNSAGAGSTVTVNLDDAITLTTVNASTLNTNVAAAAINIAGTNFAGVGTDANIDINISAKGTGHVIINDLQLTTDLAVTEGGTGASTFTDHGIIVGQAAAAMVALAVGATGEMIIGNTGADPSWSATGTLTTMNATTFDTNVAAAAVTLSATSLIADGTDADISINITAKGTGQVIIDDLQLTTDLAVTEGGTGASTLLDHGVLIGSGTAAVEGLTVGTNGQLLIGAAGADPAFATMTSSSDVLTFTAGANTLEIVPSEALLHATGFATWGGAGNYYDDTTLGEFEVLRAGTGYIKGVLTAWAGAQTVTGMTAGNTYYIYMDDTGTIGKTTSGALATFEDYIVLFECLRDSTGTNIQYTVKENHPYDFDPTISLYLHEVIGTVIANGDLGANITLNGTQKIEIVGADELSDHGLYTDIPDSASTGVVFNQMYTDGSGKWATYQSSDTFNGYWNSAGTATAPTGNKYSAYVLYVSKDDLTTTTPTYWAVLDDQEYANLAAAQVSVTAGTLSYSTNELNKLEFAQLGYIIYKQSTSEIIDVIIAKSTLKEAVSGGAGSSEAALVSTVVTNFNGILSASDTTVQVALDTIDDWGASTTDHAVLIGNGVGTAIGSVGVGTNGQVLVGATGADPAFATVTSTGGTISFTLGANTLNLEAGGTTAASFVTDSGTATPALGAVNVLGGTNISTGGATDTITINLDSAITLTTVNATTFDTNVAAAGVTLAGTSLLADGTDLNIDINITAKGTGQVIIDDLQLTTDLAITEGGTGASTFTDHGILIGSGTDAITALGVATNGQLVIGYTGADPVIASVTSTGGTVTITPGAGTLNIESSAGVLWTEVTSGTQAMAVNSGYIANFGTLVTATLPSTAALGSVFEITGKGAGGWRIAQNASQTIYFGDTATTTGATGYLEFTDDRDTIKLVCVTANTDFNVVSSIGNITVY